MYDYEKEIKICKSEETQQSGDDWLKPVGVYAAFLIIMLILGPIATNLSKPLEYVFLGVPAIVFAVVMALLWLNRGP
ncbi:hypothetical protein B1757_13080 [Acidithiobacillus marinus]|uniref:Uncharacterized protein n=1 Tax=Acidithiobacillus marinus TaxID=187490 RepID=A0A2I1DIY6_9PROT|nr:hypothetical protein [Acidithiobacillus marinus]PKY09815.1 hypothetical protein B1757_13080 [Acidithiobacillus marinus]